MRIITSDNEFNESLNNSDPASPEIRAAFANPLSLFFGNETAAVLQTEMGGLMMKAIMQAFEGLSPEVEQTLKALPPEVGIPFITICSDMASNLTKCVLYLQGELAKRQN